MKSLLTFILFLSIITTNAQAIFETNNIAFADIKVYVTQNISFADLIVYRQSNQMPMGERNSGKWYFVVSPALADKRICFVNSPSFSDINVYYTDVLIMSGWINKEKKYLLD